MSDTVYINQWFRTENEDIPYRDRYNLAGFDLWFCIQDKETGFREVVGGHYFCGFMKGFYYETSGKIDQSKYNITHYWIRDSIKPDLPDF